MPVEKEINELAHQLVERYGAEAGNVAAHRISNLEQRGEQGAAELWRRVHAALPARVGPNPG
ncbi:MAG TPA: hypothetical protein VFC38_07475 [Stellaceae bacterium]|nr:hypothetical protein [Stellaceae bacterium]